MLRSRAQFTATAYQKRITDILLLPQIAPSYGFSREWLNGGQFTNQGLELSLAMTPLQSHGGLTWVSRATYYRNYSRVDRIPVAPFDVYAPNGADPVRACFPRFRNIQDRARPIGHRDRQREHRWRGRVVEASGRCATHVPDELLERAHIRTVRALRIDRLEVRRQHDQHHERLLR